MFRELPYFGNLGTVIAGVEHFVDSIRGNHFDSGPTAQSCTGRYIAPEKEVVALRENDTAFHKLCNTAERIVRPVFLFQWFGSMGK